MLKAYYKKNLREAGCDEAGRGCLAGPVVAAAVILPPGFKHPQLNDSKQLNEKTRNLLRKVIEQEAVQWAVGLLDNTEIDEVNILKASFLAMHRSLDQFTLQPEMLVIDGNRFMAYRDIPHVCMVKGDSRFLHIAAASVLAKTHRDEMMMQLHAEYPQYGWDKNKGYPTTAHRNAIRKHGVTPYHRTSFRLLPAQLSLDI